MKWSRTRCVVVTGLLGAGALGCIYLLWPGEMAAYIDIATGRPRYFIVSGPPGDVPAPLGQVEQQLSEAGVVIIGAGCIEPAESAAYNAVILGHYLKPSRQ